jgi:hypothetical protein
MQPQPLSNEQLHQTYVAYDEDPRAMDMPAPPGSARSRRRSVQTGEHVKHRRTRSGCYTCRNRRVKVFFLQIYPSTRLTIGMTV